MARILLVEDEPTQRRALSRFLSAEGHEVRAVRDGAEARAAAPEFKPDLLITDWLLPDMTGLEVAQAVRREREEVAIIFNSGLPREQIADAASGVARSVLIEKPGTLETLKEAIDRALQVGAKCARVK